MVFIFLLIIEVRSIIKNIVEKKILDKYGPSNKILITLLKIFLRISFSLLSLKSLDLINFNDVEINFFTIVILIISGYFF